MIKLNKKYFFLLCLLFGSSAFAQQGCKYQTDTFDTYAVDTNGNTPDINMDGKPDGIKLVQDQYGAPPSIELWIELGGQDKNKKQTFRVAFWSDGGMPDVHNRLCLKDNDKDGDLDIDVLDLDKPKLPVLAAYINQGKGNFREKEYNFSKTKTGKVKSKRKR